MMVSHVAFAVHSLPPLAINRLLCGVLRSRKELPHFTVVLLESFPIFHITSVLTICSKVTTDVRKRDPSLNAVSSDDENVSS